MVGLAAPLEHLPAELLLLRQEFEALRDCILHAGVVCQAQFSDAVSKRVGHPIGNTASAGKPKARIVMDVLQAVEPLLAIGDLLCPIEVGRLRLCASSIGHLVALSPEANLAAFAPAGASTEEDVNAPVMQSPIQLEACDVGTRCPFRSRSSSPAALPSKCARARPGTLEFAPPRGLELNFDDTCPTTATSSGVDVEAVSEVEASVCACGRAECEDCMGRDCIQSQGHFVEQQSTLSMSPSHKRGGRACWEGKARFCALFCKYPVIHQVAKERNWLLVYGNSERFADRVLENCNVYWVDTCKLNDVIPLIEPWMKLNHFPGMNDLLARKAGLAKILSRMQRVFPAEFKYFPATWILPQDLNSLKSQFPGSGRSRSSFIVKPDRGARGRGIFITHEFEKIKSIAATLSETMVAQSYLADPMLISGMKFDLRLYLLVGAVHNAQTGSLDFRLFLFRDGLVRLCTTAYRAPTSENEIDHKMHLTNYAVNKHSENYESIDTDCEGSKRSLRWFLTDYEEQHGAPAAKRLWKNLCDLCTKTILIGMPALDMEYHSKFPKDLSGYGMPCRSFELLGFDVMLDSKHIPWLIEVNCFPSFSTDSSLDDDVKKRAISQTLDLTCQGVSQRDRATYRLLAHRRRLGNDAPDDACARAGAEWRALDQNEYMDFERVYPPPDNPELDAKYEEILERTRMIFRHPCAGASASTATDGSAKLEPKTGVNGGGVKPLARKTSSSSSATSRTPRNSMRKK